MVTVIHISYAQRLHGPANTAGGGGSHQQVGVVGHKNVGVDRATFARCDFPQFVGVAGVVDLVEETGLPIVASLDHMLGNAGRSSLGCRGMSTSVWAGRGQHGAQVVLCLSALCSPRYGENAL